MKAHTGKRQTKPNGLKITFKANFRHDAYSFNADLGRSETCLTEKITFKANLEGPD